MENKDNIEKEIRTRFAPSPTGYLHVGGARTALFNWLYARKHNGKFVLRIEDTDRERSTDESIGAILSGMKWLGMDWDEGPQADGEIYSNQGEKGPYYQSQRLDIYQKYIDILIKKDLAYKQDGAVYFRSTQVDVYDDFVIQKSDKFPVYNFAVVIDDALMKITHIIRGDDHLSNTPRQVMIYKALDFAIPKMVHAPMILGKDGERLSKRNGAVSVEEYKEMNILPEAMINYLARLGWAYKDQEFFTIEDLLDKFSLNKVGKSAAQFDQQKLEWLNSEHIKKASVKRLLEFVPEKYHSQSNIDQVVSLVQSRSHDLKQLAEHVTYFYDEDIEYDVESVAEFLTTDGKLLLKELATSFEKIEWTHDEIESCVRGFAKEKELPAKDIIHPLRVAVSGRKVSPGIFDLLALINKELVIKRIEKI